MSEEKRLISVDKLRMGEGVITLPGKTIEYKFWYPAQDKSSIYRSLSNAFGHYMVFKSAGWRTEDFLKERISELQKDDELIREHGGYQVKIKIIDVK